jgi:hypothetical protein
LVPKTCDWCKKEEKAFLIFFKPKGWIKHKTPDKIDMLFCSLKCFKTFTGAKLMPAPAELKRQRPAQVKERPQIAVPAQ